MESATLSASVSDFGLETFMVLATICTARGTFGPAQVGMTSSKS
jgi:hypothetical protein